jgi:hypothetical protein
MGTNLVKMCLPLRLGLFSLLSEKQISITDPQLNALMQHLASEPGVQYFEKPELYAQVQLQKQALDSFADHKRNLVSAKKPYVGSIRYCAVSHKNKDGAGRSQHEGDRRTNEKESHAP